MLVGVVGYGSFVLIQSRPEPTREYQASTVLIPAHERPVANPTAPAVAYAPDLQTERTEISNTAEPTQNPSHIETAVPVKRMDPALSEQMESSLYPPPPTGDYGSSAHNGAKSPPQIGPGYWKAESTAKANYFNLSLSDRNFAGSRQPLSNGAEFSWSSATSRRLQYNQAARSG